MGEPDHARGRSAVSTPWPGLLQRLPHEPHPGRGMTQITQPPPLVAAQALPCLTPDITRSAGLSQHMLPSCMQLHQDWLPVQRSHGAATVAAAGPAAAATGPAAAAGPATAAAAAAGSRTSSSSSSNSGGSRSSGRSSSSGAGGCVEECTFLLGPPRACDWMGNASSMDGLSASIISLSPKSYTICSRMSLSACAREGRGGGGAPPPEWHNPWTDPKRLFLKRLIS